MDHIGPRPRSESILRSTLAALALAVAVAIGLAMPAASPAPAAAATPPDGPRVVIIVGATHGTTSKYRDYANAAYAEAIKYTPDVVKVYSPNATWSKVKAATTGASIVIYFGHGNGWPSPYTYDPQYTTKNGFGLNATAGNGDSNTKYYGEPSVATLDLAPNAIILLHHLCYASGNSEPGHAAPSVSTARQRVDNYGAGFLRTKARAVLADGHRGPVEYLRAIFTTNQTIEQLWRTRSNANDNVTSFPSTRTPGMTAFTDPDSPTAGFYRSLVGVPSLTTRQITTGFAVPGRAAPKAVGAPIYAAPPTATDLAAQEPVATLPAETRLKVLETVSGSGDDAVFKIAGLDDPAITGYAVARDLDPRDSWAPIVLSTTGASGKAYSTAATGTHKLAGTFNESASWTVTVKRGDATVATKSGTGNSFSMTWSPGAGGSGDGQYTYTVNATDGWANGPSKTTGSFVIDSTAPSGAATLDGGAESAVVGVVRVGLDWADAQSGVTKVRLANKPDLDDAGLLAAGTTVKPAESLAWSLAVGAGKRTVYAQFQDAAGNWSGVVSDAITVAPPDTTYHPLTPVRLLDTRSAVPSGVTKLTSGKPLRFAVAGRGGVPDDAIAVTGNLTVTGSTAGGYVTLGPIVGPTPGTSTINLPKGDTRANGVVVPLDRSGKLEAVFVGGTGTAQLILDVTGYFRSADDGATYTAVKPARALDTRVAGDVTGASPLTDGVPRGVVIGGRTIGGVAIPADAVAVTGNLTVAGQTAKGYLSVTPTAQPAPTTSTLNFPTGDVRANNVTVRLGGGGRVWIVYRGSGSAHAILDVTGYFTAGDDGARWVPLAPSRVLDSRIGLGRDGAFKVDMPGSVTVVAKGGIGADASALTGNLTVTGQTRKGYTALTPTPVAAPATSTLNFPTGEARANGVTSRVDPETGKVSLVYKAGSGATTHLLLDVTGYYH
jgi:hypothetical protein